MPPPSPFDATSPGLDAERVRFVLVEPRAAGNIGSAARALKNLGFSRLVLVRPAVDPRSAEARRMAVDAADLLETAVSCPDLDAALDGARTVVGTSRRAGKQRRPHFRLDALAPALAHDLAADLAVVFGREDRGLEDLELDRCTHLVYFQASAAYPSFNLAQAVLLVAYELRRAGLPPERARGEPPADHATREELYGHLRRALLAIGYLQESTAESMMRKLRRLLGRAAMTEDEVLALRGLARQILWVARRAGLEAPTDGRS